MDAKYFIGVPEMDAQHAKLFVLIEKANQPGLDDSDIQVLVMELVNYAREHLDKEEKFLRENGLGEFLNGHVKLHVTFRETAMDIYNALREAQDSDSRHAVMMHAIDFCESWLKTHIDIEDRRYAELLSQKQ